MTVNTALLDRSSLVAQLVIGLRFVALASPASAQIPAYDSNYAARTVAANSLATHQLGTIRADAVLDVIVPALKDYERSLGANEGAELDELVDALGLPPGTEVSDHTGLLWIASRVLLNQEAERMRWNATMRRLHQERALADESIDEQINPGPPTPTQGLTRANLEAGLRYVADQLGLDAKALMSVIKPELLLTDSGVSQGAQIA